MRVKTVSTGDRVRELAGTKQPIWPDSGKGVKYEHCITNAINAVHLDLTVVFTSSLTIITVFCYTTQQQWVCLLGLLTGCCALPT